MSIKASVIVQYRYENIAKHDKDNTVFISEIIVKNKENLCVYVVC